MKEHPLGRIHVLERGDMVRNTWIEDQVVGVEDRGLAALGQLRQEPLDVLAPWNAMKNEAAIAVDHVAQHNFVSHGDVCGRPEEL